MVTGAISVRIHKLYMLPPTKFRLGLPRQRESIIIRSNPPALAATL
jgi:hypothetical protein